MNQNQKLFIAISIFVLLIASLFVFFPSNIAFLPNGSPIQGETIANSGTNDFPAIAETHWDHMPLTYKTQNCDEFANGEYLEDINNAITYIQEKTNNTIKFVKVNQTQNADITYICKIDNTNLRVTGKIGSQVTFLNAEAVPYVYTNNPNVYAQGEVFIYSTKRCVEKKPVVLIHETLHLLGLEHTPNSAEFKADIMHPGNTNCYADISNSDANKLKEIYSQL